MLMKRFFFLSAISVSIIPLLRATGLVWLGLVFALLFFVMALFFSKPRSLKKNREHNGLS